MKKKDIKAFFQAIRNSDIETVTKLVGYDKTYLILTIALSTLRIKGYFNSYSILQLLIASFS